MINFFKIPSLINQNVTLWIAFLLLSTVSCESSTKGEVDTLGEVEVEREDRLIWNWDSEFTEAEKIKLIDWIEQVFKATEETLGDYPFDVYVHFERSGESNRPVGFGLASRKGGKNMIRLYVNPAASLEELLGDWTAPHELSHLSIPFLGGANKWFSEGYATYLSRKTLVNMGYLTSEGFDSLYHSKINDSKKYYNSSTKSFVEVSDSLISNYIYGSMYWGSTSYFMSVDKELEKRGKMPFVDVIKTYQSCCRFKDKSILQVIQSFDEIIGDSICQELMEDYRNEPSRFVMEDY